MAVSPHIERGYYGVITALLLTAGIAVVGCTAHADADGSSRAPDVGATADSGNLSGDRSGRRVEDAGATDAGLSDAGAGRADTGGTRDASRRDGIAPSRRCSAEYERLINASGPTPRVRQVPWKTLRGEAPTYRKKTVSAVWKGLKKLKQSLQFECPPSATSTGLKCETNHGIVLQRATSGGGELVFAVALPVRRFEFPNEGTRVRLTYRADRYYSSWTLERASDGVPILGIRATASRRRPMDGRANPEKYVDDYGNFEVAMRADIDRPSSAHCITTDHCGRLLRVEPLSVLLSTTRRIPPGTSGKFHVAGGKYELWHLVSYRRNQDLGPESSCGDITYPAAAYAFARLDTKR